MEAVHDVMTWYDEHKAEFAPPICNKMMHKKQLSVMFVGGPNTRSRTSTSSKGANSSFRSKATCRCRQSNGANREWSKSKRAAFICFPRGMRSNAGFAKCCVCCISMVLSCSLRYPPPHETAFVTTRGCTVCVSVRQVGARPNRGRCRPRRLNDLVWPQQRQWVRC